MTLVVDLEGSMAALISHLTEALTSATTWRALLTPFCRLSTITASQTYTPRADRESACSTWLQAEHTINR